MRNGALLAAILAAAAMTGCATPGPFITRDSIDHSLSVMQFDVPSWSFGDTDYDQMGLSWSQNDPDSVLLDVAVPGIHGITGLSIRADGRILINDLPPVDGNTDFDTTFPDHPTSSQSFSLPWQTFIVLANARNVHMRVETYSSFVDTTYGKAHPSADVNAVFAPFIAEVEQARALAHLPPLPKS